MNRLFNLIALAGLLMITACEKDMDTAPSSPVLPDDKRTILLKDVVEQGMPSPYFHFDYDSGYASHISFASGFFQYDVKYNDKRVASMTNRPDGAKLTYFYSEGKVARIRKEVFGLLMWSYEMKYTNNQLNEVKWYRHHTAGDSILERKMELFYRPDGNLSMYKNYMRTPGAEPALVQTVIFTNYDNGKNVDDFYLYKSFFEDLLYLPQVKLQKNNPGMVRILGDQNDFEIEYVYTYQDGLPVQKKGTFRQTRGNGPGGITHLLTTYTYY